MPFEERPARAGARIGIAFIFIVLFVALGGVAAYMGLVERRAFDSPYVVAPAVGAIWFALRAFMQFNVARRT
jgi:hypothetical protein